ncbi:MAG: hypothetical protein JWM45_1115 [Pseudonocardiales bacterium]|jgi:hypothetical protein|nr:hypothetical protein [Pseudonocardiales bacterium]
MTTKCGQDRFLRGSILALWLLPELDLNQQPCDSRSNQLAESEQCPSALASWALANYDYSPVPVVARHFLFQTWG